MSIWSSFCTFGGEDPPYADYTDATRHYTADDLESLGSTPRGGSLDVAYSGMCGLIRFCVTEAEDPRLEGEIYLDRRQVAYLRDKLTQVLADRRGL